MASLTLRVADYTDDRHWRWVLEDAQGGFLADHSTALVDTAPEYEGFVGLHEYLRWRRDPERVLESERELLTDVGNWVAQHVLGPVGPAILNAGTPSTVRVVLPATADALLYRPIELAYVNGRPLALQDVSLVFELEGEKAGGAKESLPDRVRMLAVFSLPTDTSALALRHERHALRRFIRRVAQAHGRSIELRVLQYGVTRDLLRDVLMEGEGWDLLHFSGHGLPVGLVLERGDGRSEIVTSQELVQLLRACRSRLKLVTLSSCDSAAATAVETLSWLGMALPATLQGAEATGKALPSVARELWRDLDCAVLAMRYPVGDEFAVELSGALYDGLLGKGQPLARSLQFAMQRTLKGDPRPGVPSLSVATPALFGPRAVDLVLHPPPGRPTGFNTTGRMAYFPPEPERFVGRVEALVRGNGALAPDSEQRGVLFYGMAGAGKTACALELAYRYEELPRFQWLVWHKAPDEGQDISRALSNFALDLETQLPGLKMVHTVDSRERLERFLPTLTQALEDNSVLICIDNIESLLTEKNSWRDDRWRILIEGLLNHSGLSRLILTGRRLPENLPAVVQVEPIHALSLGEAALLARHLPRLGALMAGKGAVSAEKGRDLVKRVLRVVQGHPKLIELAEGQATDAAALEARLAEADGAWHDEAARLSAFLETGESAEKAEDFLRVLHGWTRGAANGLAEASRMFFHFLCCVEEEDRMQWVAEANWGDLWRRLEKPGDPPAIATLLRTLVERGLLEVNEPPAEVDDNGNSQPNANRAFLVRYRIHPGVTEASRSEVPAGFQDAVDRELAAFWFAGIERGIEQEDGGEVGPLVIRSALACVPYLLRINEWQRARDCLDLVMGRDASPATLAIATPYLRHIVELARGTPEELKSLSTLAKATQYQDPAAFEATYRDVLDRAVERGEFWTASVAAGQLASALQRRGRLADALEMVDREREYTRLGGQGPWSQLMDEAHRLDILVDMGRYEEALSEMERLRGVMAQLPERSTEPEAVNPWKVREAIATTARTAAVALKKWDEALTINAEIIASRRARGATRLQITHALFGDYNPLLRLGRADQCRQLLLYCRDVYEAERDMQGLASVFTALADLEDEYGHFTEACEFEERSLRYEYALGQPSRIAVSHNNLAIYYTRGPGDPSRALLHMLAAAVIRLHFQDAALETTIRGVAAQLAANPPLPASFDVMADQLEQIEGVRFREVMRQALADLRAGEASLLEVLERARNVPITNAVNVDAHVQKWGPVIAAVAAAAQGDQAQLDAVNPILDTLLEKPDWTTLIPVLRRIIAGERDAALLDGLDPIDHAIVARVLAVTSGDAEPPAAPAPQQPAVPELFDYLIEVVALAVNGDQTARDGAQAYLQQLAEKPDWAALAAVIQRVLAGERGAGLAAGLDATDTAIVTRMLERLSAAPAPAAAPPPDEPAIMATVRNRVEDCLRRFGVTYEVRPNRDLIIRQGSAAVCIRVLMRNDRCFVHCLAPVAMEVTSAGDQLARFLLEENNRLLLGKFSLDSENQTVWFEHALLGNTLDDEALLMTLTTVVLIADQHDEQIAEMSAGKRFIDA